MSVNPGHGEKFSRKREAAIASLLEHPSLAAAAEHCGISQRTIRRWLRDEEFSKQCRAERSRLLETTTNMLRAKSAEAVQVLVDLSNDKAAPPAVRVSAARSVISLAIGAEMLELEERLSELEELAKR
jgi:hypothetical protein